MKVGFIGLGRMGGHMCSNVIKAGFETYVSDLVPALVEQKVAEGAIGCKDNLEVAANMDIGFTMLPNRRDRRGRYVRPQGRSRPLQARHHHR